MALAPRRRARRLWEYWRSERRTLRQGYVALLISSGGDLLAGLALAFMTDRLQALPGLLILIPAAIGMRGNIFGALGSRLGTGIHAGVFDASRDRTGFLRQNVASSIVLTLATSLFLGLIARAVAGAFGQHAITIWDYVVISVVGGVLGSVVVGSATVLLAVVANRRAWDLDSVAAPLVTAIGDIATLPALWAASYLANVQLITVTVGVAAIVVCAYVTFRGLFGELALARRIVRESLPVLCLAGVFDILAGIVVDSQAAHFFRYPALLVLLPAFLEDTNALNGILSSRLASKLHLGLIDAQAYPQTLALLDMSLNVLFGVSVFTLVAMAAEVVSLGTHRASPGLVAMLDVSLLAGLVATVVSCALAYYSAVATFRFGFDPDNHGIPIGSSLMDLTGTLCLILAIVVFGLRIPHV